MRGGLFRFILAQRRQLGGDIALRCRSTGGLVGGAGHGGGGLRQLGGRGGGACFGGAPTQIMGQSFGFADMAGEVFVARGLACLTFQTGKLSLHFADHIFQTRQVGFGGAQTQFRFMTALVQSADARGFFQNGATRQRFLADQQTDLALTHERGRTGAGRRVREKDLNVTLAHVTPIDAIDAARFTLNAARHFDGVDIGVRRAGLAIGIVDEQGHFRDIARRAVGAAGKDDIVHFAAAHGGGTGFAHHPAHGVEQIRLAAPLGADHGREARFDKHLRRFDEALETGKSETRELQSYGLLLFFLGNAGTFMTMPAWLALHAANAPVSAQTGPHGCPPPHAA